MATSVSLCSCRRVHLQLPWCGIQEARGAYAYRLADRDLAMRQHARGFSDNGPMHFRVRSRSSIRMLWSFDIDTKWMTVWIQMDAHMVLGLVGGHGGTTSLGMRTTGR